MICKNKKCNREYEGLACDHCLYESHKNWLRAFVKGDELKTTTNGHRTIARSRWERIFKDHHMPKDSRMITACGVMQKLNTIGPADPWHTECAECKAVQV
jgi:hypothetical protein